MNSKKKHAKSLMKAGQRRVDNFYQACAYKPYKKDGYTWMVIDQEGLEQLERDSKRQKLALFAACEGA